MEDRNKYINNRLAEHYAECEKLGYEILGVFVQGSQNYKLDCDTTEYQSDIDTKAIVIPSFKDIVYGKSGVSTTHILPNNEHIDIKDIRIMFDTFKKQNINFIEILFTEYFIANYKYADLVAELRSHADEIASAHYNQSLRCLCGMSMEKLKALCHPYPSIIDKIEKYGYDPKQLHHILRLNQFIKDFTNGKSYRDCLVTSKEMREYLIDIKVNAMPLEKATQLAVEKDTETRYIKDKYLQTVEVVDTQKYDILNTIKYNAMERYFKENILNG